MPTKAEGLTPDSSDEEIQAAISDCVSQMAGEHPDWDNDRCVAACHGMARTATGKPLLPRGQGAKTSRRITGI